MHPTGIVHLAALVALRDFGEKIRQRDVGAMNGDQLPLRVLSLPSALLAQEADRVAGMVAEFD
jgi:hypothetical protein